LQPCLKIPITSKGPGNHGAWAWPEAHTYPIALQDQATHDRHQKTQTNVVNVGHVVCKSIARTSSVTYCGSNLSVCLCLSNKSVQNGIQNGLWPSWDIWSQEKHLPFPISIALQEEKCTIQKFTLGSTYHSQKPSAENVFASPEPAGATAGRFKLGGRC